MNETIHIVIGFAIVVLFLVMLFTSKSSLGQNNESNEQLIDPEDDAQLGYLIGMMGGDIKEVAKLRLAIQIFKEKNDRPPTTQDIGYLIGMLRQL